MNRAAFFFCICGYSANPMEKTDTQRRKGWSAGLSGRLLALTAGFVMLSEVLVFVPSISRFRLDYLENQLVKAQLAILALEATPDRMVDDALARRLLNNAGAHAISLKRGKRRLLMLGEKMPRHVDVVFDLREETWIDWVGAALATLVQRDGRLMRVTAAAPNEKNAEIDVLLDEAPLRQAMLHFAQRILILSLVISFITAGLVYLVLQWLMVRPILRITESITRFHAAPEDESVIVAPTGRRDEIGAAERALAAMQRDLRDSLRQKKHLAALGTAVAKINHDLKNTLATAVLASDRLADIDEPEVRKLAPRLLTAIDRAVALCGRTLEFVREDQPDLHETTFSLDALVADVAAVAQAGAGSNRGLQTLQAHGCDVMIRADREQIFRVFNNLALNAAQAGATAVDITARLADETLLIDVRDNGPGIPAPLQALLFQPFASFGRNGGSGLGLVIAREITQAHGGELTLADTGPSGTTFQVALPARRLQPAL